LKAKIILFFILSSIVFLSCNNHKDEKLKSQLKAPIFQITGSLSKSISKSISLQEKEENTYKVIATATLTDNFFSIDYFTKLPLKTYYLKVGDVQKRIPLLIDNTDIHIAVNNSIISKSVVSGVSVLQNKYNKYVAEAIEQENLFFYQKTTVVSNLNSSFGAIVLNDMLGETEWRLNQTKELYDRLNKDIQDSELGKSILGFIVKTNEKVIIASGSKDDHKDSKFTDTKKELTQEKIIVKDVIKDTTKKYNITSYAPYFYAFDLNGTEKSAKVIFNKNRIVLIDFWASWCVPCRAQNPDFVRLYNKYHAKGFEIISVSQDNEPTNCQTAITQDNMQWINLIDNHKAVANMYHVNAIPNAFLVDSQGGIIAKDIGSGKLEQLLKQEFGY